MSALTLCDPELVFIALPLFAPDSSGLLLRSEQVPHRVIMTCSKDQIWKNKVLLFFFLSNAGFPPVIQPYGDFYGGLWKNKIVNDLQKMSPALL